MPRIIRDFLRRQVWTCVVLVALLTAVWLVALRPDMSTDFARFPYAFSFYVDLIGSLFLIAGPDSLRSVRLVYALPVRRADLGASIWLLGVVGPALLTTTAKALAVGIVSATSPHASADLPWVMCSGIFDLAYTGSLCWLLLQSGRAGHRTTVGRWIVRVCWTAGVLAYLGGALVLARFTPIAWNQWTWPIGLVLAGMMGLTISSYLQSERLAVFGAGSLRAKEPTRSTRLSGSATRVPFRDRLSGLRQMVWRQFWGAGVIAIANLVLLTILQIYVTEGTPDFAEIVRISVSQTTLYGFFLLTGSWRWYPARLRLLRSLPLSTPELNLLILVRPAVAWFAFWLVMSLAGSLTAVPPQHWMALGVLAGAVGVTCVVNAAALQWHTRPWLFTLTMFMVAFVTFAGGGRWLHTHGPLSANAVQLCGLAFGICGVAAAAVWNQQLLTRSSTLYKRAKSTSMFSAANA